MSYENLFLVPNSDGVSLETAEAVLKKHAKGAKLSEKDGKIIASYGKWRCTITWNDKAHVAAESKEMAEHFGKGRKDQKEIARAAGRFELKTDNDASMDHMNDYAEVVEAMEKIKGVKTWDGAQQAFL